MSPTGLPLFLRPGTDVSSRARETATSSRRQPPPVERAKVHGFFAILVGFIANGKENDITLITLYVLQILDEQRFLGMVSQVFQLNAIFARFRQKVIKSDFAERC